MNTFRMKVFSFFAQQLFQPERRLKIPFTFEGKNFDVVVVVVVDVVIDVELDVVVVPVVVFTNYFNLFKFWNIWNHFLVFLGNNKLGPRLMEGWLSIRLIVL